MNLTQVPRCRLWEQGRGLHPGLGGHPTPGLKDVTNGPKGSFLLGQTQSELSTGPRGLPPPTPETLRPTRAGPSLAQGSTVSPAPAPVLGA